MLRSATGHRSRCSARRSTTRRARRSTRVRACSGSATGRGRDRPARARGRPRGVPVPRRPRAGLDFSFSGLKTALLYAVRELGEADSMLRRADLAASYQHAIVRARRTPRGRRRERNGRIAVVGGAAANSELRAALPDARFAPLALCTDNAAMIASAARFARPLATPDYLALDAYSSRDLTGRAARSRCSPPACSPRAARRATTEEPTGAEGWQGLLGSRPLPELGGRWIVVLRAPSLADRVRAAGGRERAPDAGLDDRRPRRAGAGDRAARVPRHPRSARAVLRPRTERVRGIHRPAAAACARAIPRCRACSRPGRVPGRRAGTARSSRRTCSRRGADDGPRSRSRGRRLRVTIALLDTGVDTRHPFLQGRLVPGLGHGRARGATPAPSRIRRSRDAPSGTAPSSQG